MIVGISGRKQSGKSSCAQALMEQGGFVEVNFADELKEIVKAGFGAAHHQVYGDNVSKEQALPCRRSARRVMQQVGEGLRQIDDEVWIRFWRRRIMRFQEELGADAFVVGDVRYPNEVSEIHRWGGVVVRLTRRAHEDSHFSEHALSACEIQWERAPRAKFDDGVYFDEVIDNREMTGEMLQRAFVGLCEEKGWV